MKMKGEICILSGRRVRILPELTSQDCDLCVFRSGEEGGVCLIMWNASRQCMDPGCIAIEPTYSAYQQYISLRTQRRLLGEEDDD